MLVNFTKMHGLGNDFVVIDLIRQRVRLNTAEIKKITDRKFGIGCDQLLLIEPPNNSNSICFVRIYNQNGQEAAQCGNGIRCAAKYALESGLTNNHEFLIECNSGEFSVSIDQNLVQVEFSGFPLNMNVHNIELFDKNTELFSVSLGNHHVIYMVDDLNSVPINKIGKIITNHEEFSIDSNVNFMQIVSKDHIKLKVYEAGVGETLACGSGACASVIIGFENNFLNSKVKVQFQYGELEIEYKKTENVINMLGPTTSVYIGTFRV